MALTAGDPLWYYKVLGLHCDGTNNSTTFTDVKGKTVTVVGNTKISTAQYPSLTGKSSSAYFDGAGDVLTVANSTDFTFAADFTIKARVRFSGGAGVGSLIWDDEAAAGYGILFQKNTSDKFTFTYMPDNAADKTNGGNLVVLAGTTTVALDTWYAVEVTRSGDTIRLFVNGTIEASGTLAVGVGIYNPGQYKAIGGRHYAGTPYSTGYFSEIEIYKGVAVHATDYTPSSDPFPDTYVRISGTTKDADGNFAPRLVRVYRRDTGALVEQVVSDATTGEYVVTAANNGTTTPAKHVAYMHTTENGAHVPWRVLGLHCDGANTSTTFTDVKGKTVTAVGNAQISTAQYPSLTGKTSSGYVDGAGDYLTIPDSADWDFGTGAFTVRIRARFSGVTTAQALVSNYLNSGTGFSLVFDGVNSKLQFLNGTTALLDVAWSPSTNTWYDIEVSRYGTSLRGFVNGTQVGATATNSTNITGSTSTLFIGARDSTNQLFTGYFSEVEIYNGAAVHTAAFTSLTVPFYDAIGTATDNAIIFDDITPY